RSTNEAWLSRYLLDQYRRPSEQQIPPFLTPSRMIPPQDLLNWLNKHRPEVILVAGGTIPKLLASQGVRIPQDVKVVNLIQRHEPGLAGIDPHTDEVGRAAISLLTALLQGNHLGPPDFPQSISVKGQWIPGDSFPE
ncbi:MAG: substrate-binding domain-containing protein, partial [Puniceicoccales bacterium]